MVQIVLRELLEGKSLLGRDHCAGIVFYLTSVEVWQDDLGHRLVLIGERAG